MGRQGWQLKNAKFQPARNSTQIINNRWYSGHAVDQIQNTGLPISAIEETIVNGIQSENKVVGRLQYYDQKNQLFVVTEGDEVVTVMIKSEKPN